MEKIFITHPWIIAVVLLWTIPWKGVALWRSARRGHLGWFLTLMVLNTLAILDIIYIFIFSEKEKEIEKDEQENVRFGQQLPKQNPDLGQSQPATEVRRTRRTSVIQNRSKIL